MLVCHRCADGEPNVQAVVEHCDECGHAVWVALSSPEVDRFVCLDCLPGKVDLAKQRIEPLTKTQLTDVLRYLRDK